MLKLAWIILRMRTKAIKYSKGREETGDIFVAERDKKTQTGFQQQKPAEPSEVLRSEMFECNLHIYCMTRLQSRACGADKIT